MYDKQERCASDGGHVVYDKQERCGSDGGHVVYDKKWRDVLVMEDMLCMINRGEMC